MNSDIHQTLPEVYSPIAGQRPLVGYRCWRVQDNQLYPPARGFAEAWKPQLHQSTCKNHASQCQTFNRHCSCGLYAVGDNSPSALYRTHYFDLDTRLPHMDTTNHVIGAVLLFDVHRLPESSFVRGHYGVITGLLCPPIAAGFDEDLFYTLCDHYSVPFANNRHELKQTATEHILMTSWEILRQQQLALAQAQQEQHELEQQQRLFGWGSGHVAARPSRFTQPYQRNAIVSATNT